MKTLIWTSGAFLMGFAIGWFTLRTTISFVLPEGAVLVAGSSSDAFRAALSYSVWAGVFGLVLGVCSSVRIAMGLVAASLSGLLIVLQLIWKRHYFSYLTNHASAADFDAVTISTLNMHLSPQLGAAVAAAVLILAMLMRRSQQRTQIQT
jgi:hypothetical protein